MEKQTEQKDTLTKAKVEAGEEKSEVKNGAIGGGTVNAGTMHTAREEEKKFLLSRKEAEEYRNFKRQKKVEEIMAAVARSGGIVEKPEEAHRVCERALRLKQSAVRVSPTLLEVVSTYLTGSKVKMDCIIGGNGETWTKVKVKEARMALRRHVGELTVILSPSMVAGCRYAEIRKELKSIVRVAKQASVKIVVDKTVAPATLSRLARIACEVGAKYFSVTYFSGCERLRFDLSNGCLLEVSGIEKLSDFQKMIGAGVGRIVTSSIWDIYTEWMRDVEKIDFPVAASVTDTGINSTKTENEKHEKTDRATEEKPKVGFPLLPAPQRGTNGLSGLHAKTEGHSGAEVSDLKFL